MSKSLSSSQESPTDHQRVEAGESRELGQATAKMVEGGDAAVAKAVAAQAEDMEEDVEGDMEEAVAEEPRPWPMVSTFQTSQGLSPTRNGQPLSQVRTGAMSMKKESAGAHRKALLERSVQLRLLLPLLTDRPSLLTTLR